MPVLRYPIGTSPTATAFSGIPTVLLVAPFIFLHEHIFFECFQEPGTQIQVLSPVRLQILPSPEPAPLHYPHS